MTLLRRRHKARSHRNGDRRYLAAAALAALGVIVFVFWAFVKHLPFESQYEIRGQFTAIDQLRPGSQVRMSGVTIGAVTGIASGRAATSLVTMTINDRTVPIRRDATLAILPRTVLEGNDYVLVNPGTVGAPVLSSGGTIPASQTSHEVQLDQVLDVLTVPTRQALVDTVSSLSQGLGGGNATGAATGPVTGAQALRRAAHELAGALNSVTVVASAAQGTQPGDLSRAIGSTGQFSSQLAADPAALADIVTNFDRVSGALASEDEPLAAGVTDFDQLTHSAPGNLAALDRALPPLTSFANDLRPTLHLAPPRLAAFNQLLGQLEATAQPSELPRLLTYLRPVTANLPSLEQSLQQLFGLVTPASTCVSRNIVPAMDTVMPDGSDSTGRPAWQDLVHFAANLAATAAGFDGNGTTLRLGLTEGDSAVTALVPGLGKVFGISPKIEGVRPQWLGYGVTPAFRPDQPCDRQPLPNMAADSGGAPGSLRYASIPPLSAADRRIASGLAGTGSAIQSLLRSLLGQVQVSGAARPHGGAVAPHHSSYSRRPRPTVRQHPRASSSSTASAPSVTGSAQTATAGASGGPEVSGGPLQTIEQLLGIGR